MNKICMVLPLVHYISNLKEEGPVRISSGLLT